MYSNCCCSCSFEREIIKIGQSSHKMYSNNILNFQEYDNFKCLHKKVWKLIECITHTHTYIYIYIYTHTHTHTHIYISTHKKLDDNYTRMLRAILNKSWRQHLTKHQLYGHLPPITKIIQVRRTRHTGHC